MAKRIVEDIDERLLAEVQRESGIADPEEAAEFALTEYLRIRRVLKRDKS